MDRRLLQVFRVNRKDVRGMEYKALKDHIRKARGVLCVCLVCFERAQCFVRCVCFVRA